MRYTAAGTAQVFHLIPLHQTERAVQLPILFAKVRKYVDSRRTKVEKTTNNYAKIVICKYFCIFAPMNTCFMIAAPTSGSGKTTIARGLMALFASKGNRVQPFKCGPDYIDTKFHERVCERPSINLDSFMASEEHVKELFAYYGKDADICVVEGMMGLYDGYDRDRGSSAEIARILGIPVVLVVDAKSAAYSMAPLLYGFTHFTSTNASHLAPLNIAGVIFNKVGSEQHYRHLKQVCDDLNIACFGYLPKQDSLEQSSRYLGLDFSKKAESHELVHLLEEHVRWEALEELFIPTLGTFCSHTGNISFPYWDSSVLIARNSEAFSFVYQEVLDSFSSVCFFDPETEVPSLKGIDLLYLPGGYPEKHLEALVRNEACRKSIKEYAEKGGRIIAECGGMMYLCETIVTDEGEWPMCGVLPYSITARKADRKLSLGYRQFVIDGKEYRGHEFHYTQFLGEKPKSITQVFNAKGEPVETPVIRHHHVFASYTHLYNIQFTV